MTELRKFGLLFAAICGGVALYSLYREGSVWPYAAGASLFFLLSGLFFQRVLRPIHASWMKVAHVLGWVNTRLLLGLFFYLVLTPVGLVIRLFGKDLIQQKIDRSRKSYWVKRETGATERGRYERLF